MNTIVINGKKFQTNGNNVSIINNSVYVDGDLIAGELNGVVKIKWEGDLANLTAHNVEVEGNVMGNLNAHNVECGDVGGNVTAHNVEEKKIAGSVSAKNVR